MARSYESLSPERVAELLRLALPLMSRQAAAPHPRSYAVWFEHVSGRNAALSREIEAMTAGGRALDEEQTARLYDRHIASVDEQATRRVADGFGAVLQEMNASVQQAGEQTERFGGALARWSRQVGDGLADAPEAIEAIQADTSAMRGAVGALEGRLTASRAEIDRLQVELVRAREEALRDALTGLANRRAFDQRLEQCLASGAADWHLVLADIDHFKRINDVFGHLFGDQVLKAVAQALRGAVGASHLAARVGGEEFALLLGGTTPVQAAALAEKVRGTIAGSRIKRGDGGDSIGQVTVSLGVAPRRAGESAQQWYDRADRALYASKSGGRNRVTSG